jgi:hypothetical protein
MLIDADKHGLKLFFNLSLSAVLKILDLRIAFNNFPSRFRLQQF